jgi:NAD(P)-dependent dehydrogenase (short-subunit alcohol dehydrogenase family)
VTFRLTYLALLCVLGWLVLASYSAAKGGVAALTRQAAFEYAPHNVLINAIAPGTIDTPILADITEEMRQANAGAHLIRRLGRPEEIASMVAYFLREGPFLTGLTYPVDGGWSAKGNF